MTFSFDPADLQPVVETVVAEVLQQVEARGVGSDDRLAYLENEAAEKLGVRPHTLRDARLRGELVGTKIGGRNGYEKSELIAYLARQRQE